MKDLYTSIYDLSLAKGITVSTLAKDIGISKSTLSDLKHKRKETLSLKTLSKIADYFNVSLDYFNSSDKVTSTEYTPELNNKDLKDIAKQLEQILGELDGGNQALMFDGEPLDEETKMLLRQSLENSMIISKISAKNKFTPKKYK